ncbi:hypothetical protein K2173_027804 [Erythroxylum novogranatense]|uniref:NAD-dependent epimerase/dehydratase domain-containing protein n=1 Tax=Erythroxylum novogranatense TaxID=1862640 RepID=A0AAV8U003_9ROSI|nr:hypothetical protein K2173_027804 [Erythroxylum novogranatense]
MIGEVEKKERVCVTGAGGYTASWLVKFLLAKGYVVHGTARDPCDEKNRHLKRLENASENLKLFKADLFDYEGLCSAVSCCSGVFHVACPVPFPGTVTDPQKELIEPSVTGTKNVLNACLKAKVKRVVVVSSVGAVMQNPNWPKDEAMDENCWSDKDFCRSTENYYFLGKTMAEIEALEFAKRYEQDLQVITVCPALIIGPMLQSPLNSTSLFLLTLLKDGHQSVADKNRPVVDVRDVAEALMLVYEKPEAKGRYICSSYSYTTHAFVDTLKTLYPNYSYPKSFTDPEEEIKVSSMKLQKLGWKFRPLDKTLADMVRNYEERGLLSNVKPCGCSEKSD